MSTGEKIKQARKNAGLTQKELGEKLGVSQAAIGQFESENSNPKLQTIRKIAEALSVTLSEIVDDWTTFTDEELKKDCSSAKLVSISDEKNTFVKTEDFHNYMSEKVIDQNLKLLNRDGKLRLASYSEDLTKIPEYRKE